MINKKKKKIKENSRLISSLVRLVKTIKDENMLISLILFLLKFYIF